MEEILHLLIGSFSHYLQGFLYIPGGAGFLPSTVSPKSSQNHMVGGDISPLLQYFPCTQKFTLHFSGDILSPNISGT